MFECECGGHFTKYGKSRHMKTQMHKQYIDDQTASEEIETTSEEEEPKQLPVHEKYKKAFMIILVYLKKILISCLQLVNKS